MGVYGYVYLITGFWVSIGIYECLWVSMGICGFLGIYGYLWVSCCLWLFMGVYGCLHTCLWVSGSMGIMGVYAYYIETLKIMPIFSFKNLRKRLKSHMCYKK